MQYGNIIVIVDHIWFLSCQQCTAERQDFVLHIPSSPSAGKHCNYYYDIAQQTRNETWQNLQDREQIQLSFCAGKIKVVVATVAFGMGVDAQGVRGVVHMTLPRSLEEYVQQVIC